MKIFETLDDNIVLIDGVKYQRMVNETPKPITLELIIVECMIGYNNTVIPELIENILDRVQVEWLPDEHQSYSGYNEGWNDCLETIKGNIKQNGEKKMIKKYPKWEEVYTKELTLQVLFEKIIELENRMKDEVLMLQNKIEHLEMKESVDTQKFNEYMSGVVK